MARYRLANLQEIGRFADDSLPSLAYDKSSATTSNAVHSNKVLLVNVVPDDTFEQRCQVFRESLAGHAAPDAIGLKIEETFFDSVHYREIDKPLCASESSTERRISTLVTNPVDALVEANGKNCATSCHRAISRDIRAAAVRVRIYDSFLNHEEVFRRTGLSDTSNLRRSARNKSKDFRPTSTSAAPAVDGAEASDDQKYETFADLATVTVPERKPLLLGEVKVPWKHSLRFLTFLWSDIEQSRAAQKEARVVLAQIVSYMQKFRLRYGYLTTYNETVFLELAHDLQNDQWSARCSPIVYWDGKAHYDEEHPQSQGQSSYNLRLALAMIQNAACDDPNGPADLFEANLIASTINQGRRGPDLRNLSAAMRDLSVGTVSEYGTLSANASNPVPAETRDPLANTKAMQISRVLPRRDVSEPVTNDDKSSLCNVPLE